MTLASFERVTFALGEAWSSPFVRWQRSLQHVNSLDLAVGVTRRALADRAIDPTEFSEVVLGWTVPQQSIFYGAPTLAARIGAPKTTGPMVSQACATSVAGMVAAARTIEQDGRRPVLLTVTDRTSNGPVICYPNPQAQGGAPVVEHWVADNFAADPWGGSSMAETAEGVAREHGLSREECDDVAFLRHQQYAAALADDRAFQRRYLVPVTIESRRGSQQVDADEGVFSLDRDAMAALPASTPGGVVTRDTQTHPADGCAGVVLRGDRRGEGGGSGPVVRVVAAGFARAERARMPKAVVPAARAALSAAGRAVSQIDLVGTHNPFVVSDVYFSREMDYPVDRMNLYGSSLVYGHPQAPTGLRGIIELAHALALRGGGIGLFTGCAAGDTAGALVIQVDDH